MVEEVEELWGERLKFIFSKPAACSAGFAECSDFEKRDVGFLPNLILNNHTAAQRSADNFNRCSEVVSQDLDLPTARRQKLRQSWRKGQYQCFHSHWGG